MQYSTIVEEAPLYEGMLFPEVKQQLLAAITRRFQHVALHLKHANPTE
jgi:hypothetical protein